MLDPRSVVKAERKAARGKRLNELMLRLENQLASQYVAMVRRAKARLGEQATVAEVATVIAHEADIYAELMTNAFVNVGRSEAKLLSRRLKRTITFDTEHADTRAVADAARRRFLSGFRREQSASASQAIVRAGRPASSQIIVKAAKSGPAKDAIGLTPGQEQVVENYRRALAANSADALRRQLRDRRFDSTVETAQNNNEPLSWAQINRMTARYRDRYIAYRARTIARTQSLGIVNAARQAALIQAADQANFDPDSIVKVWNSVMDDRTRDSHAALDGDRVEGMDTPFQADGGPIQYPGDPGAPPEEIVNCRCWLEYELPGEAELNEDEF